MNRMQDVLFLTVEQRLARLILRLADEFPGTATSGKRFVNIRLTHQELADLIGSNREAVSATLARLRRARCVNAVRGFLVLGNEDALRRAAFEGHAA
jgi:CRP/FNR family transcriptional regulator